MYQFYDRSAEVLLIIADAKKRRGQVRFLRIAKELKKIQGSSDIEEKIKQFNSDINRVVFEVRM